MTLGQKYDRLVRAKHALDVAMTEFTKQPNASHYRLLEPRLLEYQQAWYEFQETLNQATREER